MSFLSLSSIEKSVCSCQGGDNGYDNYVVSLNNSKLGVNPITTILHDILPKVFHLQNTFKTILYINSLRPCVCPSDTTVLRFNCPGSALIGGRNFLFPVCGQSLG